MTPIKQLMKLFEGDLNDTITRHRIEEMGDGKIICSEVNNTPDDINRNHLICWYEGKEYRMLPKYPSGVTFLTRKLDWLD